MSKNKILKPIEFRLLEEGRVAISLDELLAEARDKLLQHVARYGPAATIKSKSAVTLTLTISPTKESADESGFGTFAIESRFKVTTPGRPHAATLAIAADDQDGTHTLFVRSSGGTGRDEDPRQMKLAMDDGRAVDPDTGDAIDTKTGEVIEKPKPKAPPKSDAPKASD